VRAALVLVSAFAIAAGCVEPIDQTPGDATETDGGDASDATGEDDGSEAPPADDGAADHPWTPPAASLVYVNTQTTLYTIDPAVSPDLQPVGDFAGPCTDGSGFYDIAIDGDGNLVGIAAEGLYAVDHDTAVCTLLHAFPADAAHYFSLSYVKGADAAAPDTDVLFAASVEQGEWLRIDPTGTTAAEIFRHVGYYDPSSYRWISSGDIVSVQTGPASFRTFATIKCSTGYTDPGCTSDWLAEIEPTTGVARLIGETGFQQVFGLGFWGNRVYGFTNGGDYVRIDVGTGRGELVQSLPDSRFWGAGTTTQPYVLL